MLFRFLVALISPPVLSVLKNYSEQCIDVSFSIAFFIRITCTLVIKKTGIELK